MIQLPTRANRSPTRNPGSAPGRITFRTRPQRFRPNVWPASTSFRSTPRMPAWVFRYTGNVTASATRNTFGSSPTPIQMITSGSSPSTGTARAAWMTGSSRSSPAQNSPVMTASVTPAVTPSASPSTTRCSEISMADWSAPSAHSSRPASTTASGEASSNEVNTCALHPACQSTITRTGPVIRRASRGMRNRGVRCLPTFGRTSTVAGGASRSAILRHPRDDRVVPGGLGLAEQRRDTERGGQSAGGGHQVDHLLQRRLHPGGDRDVGLGAAGGEDQLGHLRCLVLDVHVVVGDELALVRLLPVLRLDDPLAEVVDGGQLGLVGERRGGREQVAVAGRGHRLDGRQHGGVRVGELVVGLLLGAHHRRDRGAGLQRGAELLQAHVHLVHVGL